jgi:hypothetical protein
VDRSSEPVETVPTETTEPVETTEPIETTTPVETVPLGYMPLTAEQIRQANEAFRDLFPGEDGSVQVNPLNNFNTSYYASPDEIDQIMTDLIEEYGVADISANIQTQLMTFWHRQGLSSPGYYISYTASFVVAYQIYQLSLSDYEAAVNAYVALVEEIAEEDSFLDTIKNAGLASPFSEKMYQNLK